MVWRCVCLCDTDEGNIRSHCYYERWGILCTQSYYQSSILRLAGQFILKRAHKQAFFKTPLFLDCFQISNTLFIFCFSHKGSFVFLSRFCFLKSFQILAFLFHHFNCRFFIFFCLSGLTFFFSLHSDFFRFSCSCYSYSLSHLLVFTLIISSADNTARFKVLKYLVPSFFFPTCHLSSLFLLLVIIEKGNIKVASGDGSTSWLQI